jgi:O-antigen ligase
MQSIRSQSGLGYRQSASPFLALLGVCVVLFGLLLWQLGSPPVVFGVMALALACVIIPAKWPFGALVILSVASVMPRVKVELGGWNARPEHCAALLVLIVFLFRRMFRESPRIALTGADYWVAAFVVWSYVSSAWMSPDPRLTLRWALLNNLAILPYFLVRLFITDQRILRQTFHAFLAVGVIECVYAIISYGSRHLFGTSFGVEVGQYAAGLEGVYGTQYEPNILGSFSACLAIMLLVLAFLTYRKAHWTVGGTIVALVAMLISLSRAAFLSFVFASVVLLFLGLRRGVINRKRLLPLGLVLALFVVPIAATGGKDLLARFANLSQDEVQNDVETMGRLVSWTLALEDIWQHPVVGNGTASFQLIADTRQDPLLGDRPWVANSVVRILHDTGLIGLFLFGALVISMGRSVKRLIASGAEGRDIVIALAAGCLVYAVAFMSAEGTMLSFFWVHMGLVVSACSVANGAAA